jgi:hypothetical protein
MSATTKIEPAEPDDARTAALYEEAMTAMRGTLHAMRRMPGVHMREHEAPVIERFQTAARRVKELAEYADEMALACLDHVAQLEANNGELERASSLVEMIRDVGRGVRDNEELLDYVREHWDGS